MIEYQFETLECELDEIIQIHHEITKTGNIIHDYGMITARRIRKLLQEVANSNDPFDQRLEGKLLKAAEILGVEV